MRRTRPPDRADARQVSSAVDPSRRRQGVVATACAHTWDPVDGLTGSRRAGARGGFFCCFGQDVVLHRGNHRDAQILSLATTSGHPRSATIRESEARSRAALGAVPQPALTRASGWGTSLGWAVPVRGLTATAATLGQASRHSPPLAGDDSPASPRESGARRSRRGRRAFSTHTRGPRVVLPPEDAMPSPERRRYVPANVGGAIYILDTEQVPAQVVAIPVVVPMPSAGDDTWRDDVLERGALLARLLNDDHEIRQAMAGIQRRSP